MLKKTGSELAQANDHPVMADKKDNNLVTVPLESPADALLRETSAPVLRVDHNGTLTEVNDHGRPLLAILGCNIGRMAPDCITRHIPGVLISGCARNESIESRGRRLRLTITTFDDRLMRALPHSAALHRVLVVVDRPKMESPALRLLPMALYTYTGDRRYSDSWISSGVEELTGFAPSRFTSSPGFWLSRIHPVDRPTVLKELGELGPVGRATIEYRFQCADGIYRWMADHMELPPGQTTVFGMMQDIDVRKKNELVIQDRNGLLEMLLDDPSRGLVVLDREARPLYMNPWFAERFGHGRKDWLGGKCRLKFHPDDSKEGRDALSRAVAGIPAQCKVRIGKKNGTWRHIELRMSPLTWRGKKLALCTASDPVTEGWAGTNQNVRAGTSVREHIEGAIPVTATCVPGDALMAKIRLGGKGKVLMGESGSI